MASPTYPTVPVSPEELPQQRMTPVVDLPPRPDGFLGHCHYLDPLERGLYPKAMPASAQYLAMVEWACLPTHSRVDAWYLSVNRRRSHWLLWSASYDDGRGCWSEALYAWALRGPEPAEVAVVYLVHDALEDESHNHLEVFDFISGTGLLSVPQLLAIARSVWPDDELPEEE